MVNNMAETEQNPAESCDNSCSACEHTKTCSSNKGQGGLPPKANIDVKHVILVLSGKGGVGKSTVAVNLAYALSNHGRQVGLLDLDIHGPNIPKMLGIEEHELLAEGEKIVPVKITGSLKAVSMAFLLPTQDSPIIWRGSMKHAVISQFLSETKWGALDYLIVDLPPGTGDEALSIVQLAPNIAGAVIVTTPQDVSTLDSSKAIKFAEKLEIPTLGIVENMSGLICPHCSGEVDLFGKGGGAKIAEEYQAPFLGSIPLDPEVRVAGDEGRPYILRHKESPTRESVERVMESLIKIVEHP
jgi:Mrp family chromosome partitioning ATPase